MCPAAARAQRLDEVLDIVTRLWAGEAVTHHSDHYQIERFRLSARPVHQPRIPIWVGGDSPGALRRAARWDGWIGPDDDPLNKTATDLVATRAALAAAGAKPGFDVAWAPVTDATAPDRVVDLEGAGATWWIEPLFGSADDALARIRKGPPR